MSRRRYTSSSIPITPIVYHYEGLPADGNLINVLNYGAIGDGVHDDTAAILAAIAVLPVYSVAWPVLTQIIYFPAGTYLVSNTIARIVAGLAPPNINPAPIANLVMYGDGIAYTKIKLADNASGYGDPANPKEIVKQNSGNFLGESFDPADGAGNEAFNNSIEGMTIDCGSGNPGAIAVNSIINNWGAIRNVALTTTTAAAVALLTTDREAPGPGLFKNLTITGPFVIGIDARRSEYGQTFEHININGTTGYGVRNCSNALSMRDFNIHIASGVGFANLDDNTISPIVGSWGPNSGLIVWIDGVISGNGTSSLIIPNGSCNLSNVKSVNFNGTENTTFDGVYRIGALIGQPDWQLPIEEHPVAPFVPSAFWQKITAPLYPVDATATIQAQLNATSATVVYFPTGRYEITHQIIVPDNIERIEILWSSLTINGAGAIYPFGVNSTRTKDLFFSRIGILNVGGMFALCEWGGNDPARLIIQDIGGSSTVIRRHSGSTGKVFIENANATHFITEGPGGAIWARQANPEITSTKMQFIGTDVWILGFKTEQPSLFLSNDGGNVELVGGVFFASSVPGTLIMSSINNGRISAAYCSDELSANVGWTTAITSTINGVTNSVLTASQPQRGPFNGRIVAQLSTDFFIPTIQFTPSPQLQISSPIGTSVGTPTLSTDFNTSGTAVWALSNDAGGKFAIDPSTGAITTAQASIPAAVYPITITVSGLTLGATGTGTIQPKSANVVINTAWNPSFLSPLIWLEAAASPKFQLINGTTAAVANGDPVGYWGDLSLHGLNLTAAANDATRPLLEGVGGHPVLRFDGVDDILRTLSTIGGYAGGSCTVVATLKSNSPGTAKAVCAESGSGHNPWYILARTDTVTASKNSAALRNNAATSPITGSNTPGLTGVFGNTDVVLSVTDTGSIVTCAIDQGSGSSVSYTRADPTTLTNFGVGGIWQNTPVSFWSGDQYAIMVFPGVVSPSDLAMLITYCGALQGRVI